jgi:FAD/FMN-containing dehydrogenase
MAATAETQMKERLAEIVGPQAVNDELDVLEGYAGCLGSTREGEPVAVVRPRDRKEVQAVVRLANELGINLVPAPSPQRQG